MGGTKKKPLSASERGQDAGPAQGAEPSKKPEEKKGKGEKQQKSKITVLLDEKQALKSLPTLKAITPQSLAKSLGVKISIANSFVRSLESQRTVECVGGYSGHRVYELLQQVKPQTEDKKQ